MVENLYYIKPMFLPFSPCRGFHSHGGTVPQNHLSHGWSFNFSIETTMVTFGYVQTLRPTTNRRLFVHFLIFTIQTLGLNHPILGVMVVKQCHKPPMTGHANHTTYGEIGDGLLFYQYYPIWIPHLDPSPNPHGDTIRDIPRYHQRHGKGIRGQELLPRTQIQVQQSRGRGRAWRTWEISKKYEKNMEKTWEYHGNIIGISWENYRKKSLERKWKTMGKSWKTIIWEKMRENTLSMEVCSWENHRTKWL